MAAGDLEDISDGTAISPLQRAVTLVSEGKAKVVCLDPGRVQGGLPPPPIVPLAVARLAYIRAEWSAYAIEVESDNGPAADLPPLAEGMGGSLESSRAKDSASSKAPIQSGGDEAQGDEWQAMRRKAPMFLLGPAVPGFKHEITRVLMDASPPHTRAEMAARLAPCTFFLLLSPEDLFPTVRHPPTSTPPSSASSSARELATRDGGSEVRPGLPAAAASTPIESHVDEESGRADNATRFITWRRAQTGSASEEGGTTGGGGGGREDSGGGREGGVGGGVGVIPPRSGPSGATEQQQHHW
jgi:hypothetical protein